MRTIVKAMFRRPITYVAAVIVLLFIVMAIFANVFAPYNPNEINMMGIHQHPSASHWLGTDEYGRDILSRIIAGSQVALIVGLGAVSVAAVFGSMLGILAGYYMGWLDTILSRLIEVMMSIPTVILGLVSVSVFGSSIPNMIIILGVCAMPGFARMARAQVLQVRELDYVEASKICGSSNLTIMFTHVLRNSLSPLIVMMSQTVGATILAEASLSYLGAGVPLTTPSWGGMVNGGYTYLKRFPETSLFPGIAIILLVVSLNILGDALRDAMDPRLRGIK